MDTKEGQNSSFANDSNNTILVVSNKNSVVLNTV